MRVSTLTGRANAVAPALHSRSRDKAAISHHYDASNDFYRLILDPSMAYSCAYWELPQANSTLAQAKSDKLDRICHEIGLHERPGMRLLDVGCGWGSLSLHAAAYYGAQVVGLTLSREQKSYIDSARSERGLNDRVEIRVEDYRALTDGPFDAVASIEMGEHVGESNYPTYARTLHKSVRPGGRVLVQQMSRRGNHPGGGPFIESFIAPDMHMRPVGDTVALLEDSGLELISVEGGRCGGTGRRGSRPECGVSTWPVDGSHSSRAAWVSIRSCSPTDVGRSTN